MNRRKLFLWLPFALCAGLFAVFYLGLLHPDDHVIASKMVGMPLPQFDAIAAIPGQAGTATADYRDGKPRMINVFASWCIPCVAEIPVLSRMKAQGVEIDGVAIHDSTPELTKFLAANGNPYRHIGLDQDGRAQIAFGSAGVPETFVVDGKGKIVYQHIGVVTDDDAPKLIAMMAAAR